MKEFVVAVPQRNKISNLGFATSVVERANTYTSDEISIRVNGCYVNAKSILGLISLKYNESEDLYVQVVGENENYTAPSFERFLEKLVSLYNE